MGSKGEINEGDYKRDYENLGPIFVTANSPINDIDIDYIEKQCGINFSKEIKQRIHSELNEYLIMKEMQDAAPHKGGSGRVNDFFAAHIRALAKIFEDAGGKIEFKRAKKIDSPGEESHSQFSYFLRAINYIYPNDLKHKGDGIVNSSRKILYETIYYK